MPLKSGGSLWEGSRFPVYSFVMRYDSYVLKLVNLPTQDSRIRWGSSLCCEFIVWYV